jgi:hypothetical protein
MNVLAANASCEQYGGCPPQPHESNLPFTGFDMTALIIVFALVIILGVCLRAYLDSKKTKDDEENFEGPGL